MPQNLHYKHKIKTNRALHLGHRLLSGTKNYNTKNCNVLRFSLLRNEGIANQEY